jgi:hypothetical protein
MNNHIAFGPAPLKTEFLDVPSALEYIQEYARPLRFCVVIRSSEKDKNGRPFRTYFRCDRGTKYVDYTKPCAKPRKKRSEDGVLAGTGSRKTNCPFQLRLQCDVEGIWRLHCNQLCHNHPPSLNSSAHPTFRRKDIQLHEDERLYVLITQANLPVQLWQSFEQQGGRLF